MHASDRAFRGRKFHWPVTEYRLVQQVICDPVIHPASQSLGPRVIQVAQVATVLGDGQLAGRGPGSILVDRHRNDRIAAVDQDFGGNGDAIQQAGAGALVVVFGGVVKTDQRSGELVVEIANRSNRFIEQPEAFLPAGPEGGALPSGIAEHPDKETVVEPVSAGFDRIAAPRQIDRRRDHHRAFDGIRPFFLSIFGQHLQQDVSPEGKSGDAPASDPQMLAGPHHHTPDDLAAAGVGWEVAERHGGAAARKIHPQDAVAKGRQVVGDSDQIRAGMTAGQSVEKQDGLVGLGG